MYRTSPDASAVPVTIPKTMRALLVDEPGPPEVMRRAEVPTPHPGMSEVLVRIVAAGVNRIDATTRAGGGVSHALSPPFGLGFDLSGVVVSSPFPAHPLTVGTEVFGMAAFPRGGGSYAEYAAVPTLHLARKPASLSHAEAAGVPLAALTAWAAVMDTARAHQGQRILIHAGAGGVGHIAIQLAAHVGAHVTATGSAANLSWLRELGAAVAIDYATTRFEDIVGDVDVVIDLVGNAADDTGSRSLQILRPRGQYILVPHDTWPGYAPAAASAGVRATSLAVIPDGSVLATIGRLIESGAVRVYLDRVFSWTDAAQAHRELESGHTRGKTALLIGNP